MLTTLDPEPALAALESPPAPEPCWICGWLVLPGDGEREQYDAERIADMDTDLAPGWHTRHRRFRSCMEHVAAEANARRS